MNARGIGWEEEQAPTLASEAGGNSVPSVCIKESAVSVYESHPIDSRIRALENVAPTVTVKFAKGTADTPLVCSATWQEAETFDAHGNGDGKTVSTLTGDHENRITDYTNVVCTSLQESTFETYQKVSGPLMANSHPGSYTGQDAYNDMLIAGISETPVVFDKEVYNSGIHGTGGHYISEGGPALRGTGHAPGVCAQYVVRRLTPTECARLQGFPDEWGHIDHKDRFTPEDLSFWQEVRNTHATINGKNVKKYTEKQMLSWYNKLHTDSAEYKMWGNGIALPTALYCMEGISEVLCRE